MGVRWFIAVVVRGSHVDGNPEDGRLGDLLYRLIEAPDAETAFVKAVELGRACRDSYTDVDGKSVSLEYLGLADLREISANRLGDGVEVYSEIVEERPSQMVVSKEQFTVFAESTAPPSFERGYEPID